MRFRNSPIGSEVLPDRPSRIEGAARLIRTGAAHAEAMALQASHRPVETLAGLLVLDGALAVCFVAMGLTLTGDQALFFRELMPGTLLSFAQLLFAAAAAWTVYRLSGARPWRKSFWGLSGALLLVFAFDEITQTAIFLSDLLEREFAVRPAGSFHDLEAVLLSLLLAGSALIVLPRVPQLLRHPRALAFFLPAVALGLASQGLDSFAAATRWEFVAEESLKLSAEAFLIGGFLVALRDVRGARATRSEPAASAPRPA